MKPRKFFLFVLLLGAVAVVNSSCIASNRENEAASRSYGIGHMDLKDKGYAVSSPQETVHENGDIVSPYPPYYRPDHGSMRR
jgi:hypothetical protein